MHYSLEIILPPHVDPVAGVEQIMKAVCKEDYDETKEQACEWYDYFVIGGRYSGRKTESRIGKDQLAAFHGALSEMKVTVSSMTAGKETLSPASQIPAVDALWRKMCPGHGNVCPLFDHYESETNVDICKVRDLPPQLTCHRLIVADKHWDKKTPDEIYPKGMLVCSVWNGINHQDTTFSGNVVAAIARYKTKDNYPFIDIGDDWNVVTVDYHN